MDAMFPTGRSTLRTRELVAAGMTRSQIAWAVGAGRLIRIRIVHYCLPGLDQPTLQAVRVGGRSTCLSELARLGVWVTRPPAAPHVHLLGNASRLRDARDRFVRFDPSSSTVLHWDRLVEPPTDARVAATDAFLHALRCLDRDDAIATIDSGLRRGLVSIRDLRRHATVGEQMLLDQCDGRADSGLETLIRVPLVDAGFRVEPQYRVAGLADIDLLVEGCVGVEADGERFHGPRSRRDRGRDALVATHGITPLRFGYDQILDDRVGVLRAIAAAVVSHRHVRGSGRRRALRLLRTVSGRIS